MLAEKKNMFEAMFHPLLNYGNILYMHASGKCLHREPLDYTIPDTESVTQNMRLRLSRANN